ncbi:MAG: hypothetical protein K6T90_02070 [Leptolyngbyaceae cyanobacterium HOT.MB2.61]|jgi:hypothetical protein|nr:hypothetical protein [Leptolyngbyaceae cyanobacterium HOT.MB2.61]
MASAFHFNDFEARHQANMLASLRHRLEVARNTNNFQLVALLEREQKQIEADAVDRAAVSPGSRLKNWWNQLVAAIAHFSDLQIWQTTDRSGVTWWHALDPRTGKEVCTDSETEMRIWIEENYWEE